MSQFYIDKQDVDRNKGLGIVISLFPVLFFLPLIMEDRKSSQYLKFRANQSLVLFATAMVCTIVGKIPLIGFIGGIAGFIVGVVSFVNFIMSCLGSTTKIPIVGDIVIFN